MWKFAALVFVCTALAVTPIALAQTQGDSNTQPVPTTTPLSPCTPLADLYSRSNWRNPHPLRGENPCPGDAAKLKRAFFLWRSYRLVAPFKGFNEGDPFLKWLAIPASIVSCETRGYSGQGRWLARNSSGAQGPAQLLGWPAPNPATTPAQKVDYWRVTAQVWHGSGSSAWSCA